MRTATRPFPLKEEVRRRALEAMREIIASAQWVMGDAVDDKRDLSATRIDSPALRKKLSKVPAGKPSDRIERLRRFLSFAQEAQMESLRWNSVESRLIRKCKCSDSTTRLLCHLLDISPDAEDLRAMFEERSATSADRPSAAGSLLVECHEMIDDHHQVILGQLPQSNLFPAVFVYSHDLKQWFPQHDLVRVDKPGGVAFVCNARFGNPHGIAHVPSKTGPFPWRGDVRVFALTLQPDKKRTPAVFTEAELDKWAADHGPVVNVATLPVIRDEPPIVSIRVESSNGDAREWVFPPERLQCSFPVDLSWNTTHTIHFEIRKTPTDEVVWKDSVLKDGKVRIVDAVSPEPVPPGVKVVPLPGDGTYRLRSWGLRKPFLESELELWLDIKSEVRTVRRKSGQRRPLHPHAPTRR